MSNEQAATQVDPLETIVESVNKTMGLPTCLWVLDAKRQGLVIAAAVELRKSYIDRAFLALSEPSVTGEAFLNDGPAMSRNVLHDGRWKYRDEAEAMGWKSVLCLPVRVHGRVLGVLSIYTKEERDFTESETQLLSAYASEVGLTLEANKRQETLTRLFKVGQQFERLIARTPKAVLQEIVEGACAVTGADCAVVYPYDAVREVFYDIESVAHHGLHEPLELKDRPRQKGLGAHIVDEKEIVRNDVEKEDPDMLRSPFISRESVKAFMGIALAVADRTLGILYVDFRSAHTFEEEEKNSIRLFAHQAALAIDNSRLFQQARVRADALERLHEVAPQLASLGTSPSGLRSVLTQIAESAQKVLGADLVDLYHYRQGRDKFELPPIQVGKRYWPDLRTDFVRADDVVHTAVRQSGPTYFTTSQQAPALTQVATVIRDGVPLERFVIREEIKSTAVVPLFVGGEAVGVLFANYRHEQSFHQQQKELIELFANQAAIAIRNAFLFEQRQVLHDLALKITSILDKDTLLQQALERSLELLGGESGSICLLNKGTNELEFQYAVGKPRYRSFPLGKGLIGSAAKLEKPVRVSDVSKDERYIAHIPETESELDVPLLIGGKLIGVLNAESNKLNAFTPQEEELAVVLAGQIAVAIQNTGLFEQNQKLQSLSRVIASHADLDEMLETILKGALDLVGCPVGSIGLLEKKSGELKFEHAIGQQVFKLSASDGFTGLAVERKEPIKSGDVKTAERYWEQSAETVSEMAVPIILNDEVIGVFNVESPLPDAFADQDEEMLVALASQAAVAIKNAQRIKTLGVLGELSAALNADLRMTRDKILDLIHARASELMDTDNMYVALYDEVADEVWFPLVYVNGKHVDTEDKELNPGWQRRKAGKGRTEYIIHTRGPIFLPTQKDSEEWYNQPGRTEYLKNPLNSWVGVPLLVGGRVLGVIATYHLTRDHVYNLEDLDVLQAIANQAAIALDNAHMYYDVNQRLEALVQFGRVITSTLSLGEAEVLRLIHTTASGLMDTANMYIALYDPDPAQPDIHDVEAPDGSVIHGTVRFGLAYVAGQRIDVEDQEAWLGWQPRRAGKGRTEHIIRTRQSLFLPTKKDSEDWYKQPGRAEYVGQTLPSWLGVPLLVGDKVLGAIATYHPENDHVYDRDDLTILQAMARQAAIAIENSRLYQQSSQLQEEVVAARQLATLGTVMAALQHRVNNTINLIVPNLDRLRKRVDTSDATIAGIMDIIDRNARYTSEIINRLQLPLQQQEPQWLQINAVLSDVANEVRETRGVGTRYPVELNLDLDETVPDILAPVGQISEVFRNLVDNAYNAMPEGGCIRLSSRSDKDVLIRVQDNGTGIPPHVQERLFVRPAPRGGHEQGTGLGLWLCSLMLQSLGGCVIIEKTSNVGTTMLVKLPVPGPH